MKNTIYQIDAFTDNVFSGNPAAVCPLEDWLDDDTLLLIAKENNLAETAFFTQLDKDEFHIRWFTPDIEMDLCGHATLATAHCIFSNFVNKNTHVIHFISKSGPLTVHRDGDMYHMQLPRRKGIKADLPDIIRQSINIQPIEIYKSRDFLLIYSNEEDIRNLEINRSIFDRINLGTGGVIVSAPGSDCDFVSRFFTPQSTILEDPVTGSSHCTLVPYWSHQLDKAILHAKQLSDRGGQLLCRDQSDRVEIAGKAITFFKGTMNI